MELTIRHTPAEGTILEGSTRGDGVYEIARTFNFRWSRHVGIYVRGSRDRAPDRYNLDRAAQALRAAGHTVTIDVSYDTTRDAETRESDHLDRASNRIEHLDNRAERTAQTAAAHHEKADVFYRNLPPGQPTMPDHYSYRADINRRARAARNRDKGHQLDDQARMLTRRADAVEDRIEHRHDPRTTMRRLERLNVDLRLWQRSITDATPGTERHERCTFEINRLTEEITCWTGQLAAHRAELWTPEHFRKGDIVNVRGHWREVKRVNKKTLTVQSDYSWTEVTGYDRVFGRRRDSMQIDTPTGSPYPVQEAVNTERWRYICEHVLTYRSYDEEEQAKQRAARHALRTILGGESGLSDQMMIDKFHASDRDRAELTAVLLDAYDQRRKEQNTCAYDPATDSVRVA